MAQQTINVGAAPNDGTGTPLRTAFQYTNSNFTELYTAVGPSGNNIVVPGSATISGDLTVDTNVLKVDTTLNRVGIGTASPSVAADVVGSSAGATLEVLRLQNSGSGLNTKTRLNFYAASTNYGAITGGFGASSPELIFDINTSSGAFIWNNFGSEAMRLNATGLGVGGSVVNKLTVTVAPGTTTSDGLRVTDSSRSIGVYQTGATYSYLGIGGNQNLIYTAGGRLDIVADGQSLFLRTQTNNYLNLDTSGNVGIGVTPSPWSSAGYVQLPNSRAFAFAGAAGDYISNGYFDGSWKYTTTAAVSRYRQDAGSHNWQIAPSGTAGNAITFTQAMTLDASGNLLVGTTTNTNVSRIFSRGTATSSALALQGASGDVALAQLTVGKFDNNTTTSQIFVRFTINDNSGGSGQINANGASQAAFGTFSDSRLKENIVSLPSQLANILSLRPVEFDYKDGSGHQIGFVAQEMQEVYSDAVGEQNGFLTVTGWSKTEARLVSAIKELAAKVQALEAKLA